MAELQVALQFLQFLQDEAAGDGGAAGGLGEAELVDVEDLVVISEVGC